MKTISRYHRLLRGCALALGLATCSLAQRQVSQPTVRRSSPDTLPSTTLTIQATPSPVVFGQPTTITASVTPPSATGRVTFYDRTTYLGVAPLVNGTAVFQTTALTPGLRSLIGRYDGDLNNQASSSGILREGVVTKSASGFAAPVLLPTPAGSQAVLMGDFNGDSKTDLLVSNTESGTVSFLAGRGDGSFAAAVTATTDASPTVMTAADFDGDGHLDVAVAVTGGIDILLGNGDGTFQPAAEITVSSAVSGLAFADMNRDGVVDLLASSVSGASVMVLIGDGNGTFQSAASYPTDSGATGIATGDFNGDGIPDVVASTTSGASVLLGMSNGALQAFAFYAAGAGPQAVTVRDFNADGSLDFAIANYTDGTVSVMIGNGNGTFLPAVSYAAGVHPTSIATGDLDGNIRQDIVVTNQTATNGTNVNVLLGNGDGTFRAALGFMAESASQSAVLGDFNGDGKTDLVATSPSYSDLSVLLNLAATVAITGGNMQTAQQNNTFPLPLQVTAYGFGVPLQNVPVTFTAPGSGASGFFNGTGLTQVVVTGQDGTATTPFYTANGLPGSELVTATAGGNTVSFSLTNAVQPCSFSVSPSSLIYDANGGATAFQVTASAPECVWSAATVSPMFTFSATGGSGSGTVSVLTPVNSTATEQTATIVIAGQSIPVSIAETTQIFADVPVTAYYFDAVDRLKAKGITSGCSTSPLDFCPNSPVTRAEMAIFLVRTIYGGDNFTAAPTPYFSDVTPSTFGFAWVQKLYELGITNGCGEGLFCPNASVTREQMAIFVIRARYGSTAVFDYSQTPIFTDVPTNSFSFPWVQRLSFDHITSGCAANLFCPGNPIIRGDMALFLMRAGFNEFLPSATSILTQASPAALSMGTKTTVTVTGDFTAFAQGVTTIATVPGITVANVQVINPNTLTVDLTPSELAPAQPTSIWAITGGQEAVLPNGLSIQ